MLINTILPCTVLPAFLTCPHVALQGLAQMGEIQEPSHRKLQDDEQGHAQPHSHHGGKRPTASQVIICSEHHSEEHCPLSDMGSHLHISVAMVAP